MNFIKFTRAFGRSITALFFGAVLASCGGGGYEMLSTVTGGAISVGSGNMSR